MVEFVANAVAAAPPLLDVPKVKEGAARVVPACTWSRLAATVALPTAEVPTAAGKVVSNVRTVESLQIAVFAEPALFEVPRVNAGVANSKSLGIGVTFIVIIPHPQKYQSHNQFPYRQSFEW